MKNIFLFVIFLVSLNVYSVNNAQEMFCTDDKIASNRFNFDNIKKIILNDIQDSSYTVSIENQIWMKRNLDVSTYRNGDSIRHAVSNEDWIDAGSKKEGAWCYNNNDPAMGVKYGKLYNWYAVNDPRGLAPNGWHVPNDTDWTNLSTYLGNQNVAGGKMKESGTINWDSPNTGATNETGFSGLPGGYRFKNGKFFGLRTIGYWWSVNANDDTTSWYIWLRHDFPYMYRFHHFREHGYSVRCLKD